MAYLHNRIVKPFLILCEGKDEENFVISYLNSKSLAYDSRFSNDIQTFDFGGNDDLTVFIGNLMRTEGFETVRHILVLRDAETNAKRAVDMVKSAFRVNGLPVPEQANKWKKETNATETAFTLLPACSTEPVSGTLEDLCWDILIDKHAGKMRMDVIRFINEIKKNYGTVTTHEHKSRLHTYFSVNEAYVSLKIGEVARAGAFDWDSEKLDGLKGLIGDGFD